VPLRCGASNRCLYCSWLTALENATVVALDSADCLPQVGFTLTTRAAKTEPAVFRDDVRLAFRALRRRWPDARYLGQIEFTTGEGERSGGHRRIHMHGLLKGVPRAAAPEVAAVARRVWHARTGAHRVEAHELHRPAGAIAYLVNHHQKTAQRPPAGWRGKRLRPSKGYYERPAAELREQARAVLADKRIAAAVDAMLSEAGAWEQLGGSDHAYQQLHADVVEQAAAAGPPVLVRYADLPVEWSEHGEPLRRERTALEVVHAS
jgi:hypothetical protein